MKSWGKRNFAAGVGLVFLQKNAGLGFVPKHVWAPCCKTCIRKDCFQVKSNLLTVDNLVFHIKLQFLIKLE
jgi:hypothetical protein